MGGETHKNAQQKIEQIIDGEENLSESEEDQHGVKKNEAKLMATRIAETMTVGNEPFTTRIEIQTISDQRTIETKLRGSKSPQVQRKGGLTTSSHAFLNRHASPSNINQ
jgi:hypothetical protein